MNKIFLAGLLSMVFINMNASKGSSSDNLSSNEQLSKRDRAYIVLKSRHAQCLDSLTKCSEREFTIVREELKAHQQGVMSSKVMSFIAGFLGAGLLIRSTSSGSYVDGSLGAAGLATALLSAGSDQYDLEAKNYYTAIDLELNARTKEKDRAQNKK